MSSVPLKRKVIVAMSGGVDSSVAAKLLADQGYQVVGIFLHFWKEELPGGEAIENKCCSTKALLDARQVANKIGIPLYTLNFASAFKKQVVADFLRQYSIGKTPNPCVICNKKIKLGKLITEAKKLGFDFVASGHYAKRLEIKRNNSEVKYELRKAKDKNKDQSYFLYNFSQKELAHLLFPLGDYTKEQVRKLAKKFKLPVADKKESQEICFIPEKSHNEFLKRHLKFRSGGIKLLPLHGSNEKGGDNVIGRHQGLPLYTIGQRKGVELGGGPYYVAKKNLKTNILYVVNGQNEHRLYFDRLICRNVNWLSDKEPKLPYHCQAVIRYRHNPVDCQINKLEDNTNKHNNYQVLLNKPQRAIASGQSVVFYKNDLVLGGGIIG